MSVGLVCDWVLGSKSFLEPCSYCSLVFWPLILQVRSQSNASLSLVSLWPPAPPCKCMETFSILCFWSCLGFLFHFFSSALRSFALKTPPFISVMCSGDMSQYWVSWAERQWGTRSQIAWGASTAGSWWTLSKPHVSHLDKADDT